VERTESLRQDMQKCELMIIFCSTVSIIIPVLFALTFFHPADPFHRIIEDVLELHVHLSLPMIFASCLYSIGAIISGNSLTVIILVGLVNFASFMLWVKAAMPKELANFSPTNESRGGLASRKYVTNNLGLQPPSKLIFAYKCLYLQCTYLNVFYSDIRLTVHVFLEHLLVVVSTFGLIRYGDTLVEQREYMMLAVCFFAIIVPILEMKMKCDAFGGMRDDCDRFKKCLLITNNRRSYVWKNAIGLRRIIILSTHPFFKISHSTFIEFLHVCVDHVVSLLCMF